MINEPEIKDIPLLDLPNIPESQASTEVSFPELLNLIPNTTNEPKDEVIEIPLFPKPEKTPNRRRSLAPGTGCGENQFQHFAGNGLHRAIGAQRLPANHGQGKFFHPEPRQGRAQLLVGPLGEIPQPKRSDAKPETDPGIFF